MVAPGRLLERDAQLALLAGRTSALRPDRRGCLVLVAGEAGIGKTALLRAFCEQAKPIPVLWGACDALQTPRALGPFIDIAENVGGELAEVVAGGAAPSDVATALASELRRRPAIVVLEDLHWADEATLDVLRLLSRRIGSLPALVVATYRADALQRSDPLQIALGELAAADVERLSLEPLTLTAVSELVATTDIDATHLHRTTGGNAFFVSEVLAAGGREIPITVRDAVLARAARLDSAARAVLDAVAIEPARMELWLLEALAGPELDGIDSCLASGMLRAERSAVGFRHEIARVVVEEALPPQERALLSRQALAALTSERHGHPDLARLAQHAEAADDAGAVLLYAPAAGERAAALRSHREAAAQFARAVRYAAALPSARRAELLERCSYESYLTDGIAAAREARRAAMREHRAAGNRLREGDAHRWLSRLAWFAGAKAEAEAEAQLAVELLEPLEPGRELAMAYSNLAQLCMLADDREGAVDWGTRAIAIAERLGEVEILAHALNNVGSAELMTGSSAGLLKVERSLALALEHDLEEHAARAHTNLASVSLTQRDYATADRHLDAGIAYCNERDLDSWTLYMSGHRARSLLDQGRWDEAAALAASVLADSRLPPPSRLTPLTVIGRLRARRGDPDPWSPLDEALAIAQSSGELQRLAPVAAARAEARWLAGEDEAIDGETAPALELALARYNDWLAGELALWRLRAGGGAATGSAGSAEPYRLELEGSAAAAAAHWRTLGCRYDAALALAAEGSEAAQRQALAELQAMGARPAAVRVARGLRERGARDLRQGPRSATRDNPGGLTPREVEVLVLVAEGLRNAEIAARLSTSERTIAHHVSAILRKLGVQTRGQAGAEAVRLGIA